MQRIPEPELMEDPAQALAYHQADFSVPHGERLKVFRRLMPGFTPDGDVLDIGCGSGDVLLRFARLWPAARFTGVDGSAAMLALAAADIARDAALACRIELVQAIVPSPAVPRRAWQLVMSHSLLHQLHRPEVLWRTIREHAGPGCQVFVADLRRPPTAEEAARIVAAESAHEPEVLRRDYYNSLCAAFEVDEVRAQLEAAGLGKLIVAPEGAHHLMIYGRI